MFQDRLVNAEDRLWFDRKMREKMADFGAQDSDVLGEGPLLYGDFMVPNADNKIYEEIVDQQKVNYMYMYVYAYPCTMYIHVHVYSVRICMYVRTLYSTSQKTSTRLPYPTLPYSTLHLHLNYKCRVG